MRCYDNGIDIARQPGGLAGGGGESGGGEGGGEGDRGEDKLKKLGKCIAAQYGLGNGKTRPGLNLAKALSQVGALPVPKSLVGIPIIGNSSSFTNVLNYSSHLLGINTRFSGQAARITKDLFGSIRIATVLGRANVVVGGVLLTYDAASIAICTARND